MAMLALALAYSGWVALCLSMDRHHRELMGRPPKPARRYALRAMGWALVALAAWPCVAAWGWAMGAVGWLGLLTVAALPLVFLLPHAPRLAIWLAPALPALAAIAFLTP